MGMVHTVYSGVLRVGGLNGMQGRGPFGALFHSMVPIPSLMPGPIYLTS